MQLGAHRLLVTADDLGLDAAVNAGISRAHREGIVRSASLLICAPATEDALRVVRATPSLEVGLHLAFVESYSALGRPSSLTEAEDYFGGQRPCLHRDWRRFLRLFTTGRIDLGELEAELDAQLVRFKQLLGPVPFLNSTQHLHLLPGLQRLVLRLAQRHGVKAIRVTGPPRLRRRRALQGVALSAFGAALRVRAERRSLRVADDLRGFADSGAMLSGPLRSVVRSLRRGVTELVVHPGLGSPALRRRLPRSYGAFRWADELSALRDPRIREALRVRGVSLIQFGDLG